MNSAAILVSSFDRYEPCWSPFCHGLQKYWPEHFQPLYFITNEKSPPCGEALQLGADRGWTDNLRAALERVPHEYILYAQEDYWIDRPVNDAAVRDYLAIMQTGQADYIRLMPVPPPTREFGGDARLGVLDADAEYRTSLQMALWRKSALLALLKSGESPWQFEVQGSQRSHEAGDRFLCVRKRRDGISYVFTAIVDGEWSPLAFEYARCEGIEVRFGDLPCKPFGKLVRDRVHKILYGCAKGTRRRMTGK